MPGIASSVLNKGGADLRRRLIAIYAVLLGGNVLVWLWALVALSDRPVMLGTALLAYTFGLRHAVDADHIAAVDNVTRKLMQQGQRPVGVGFFFALGHSTVVVALSVAVAFAAAELTSRFDSMKAVGGIISTRMLTRAMANRNSAEALVPTMLPTAFSDSKCVEISDAANATATDRRTTTVE